MTIEEAERIVNLALGIRSPEVYKALALLVEKASENAEK